MVSSEPRKPVGAEPERPVPPAEQELPPYRGEAEPGLPASAPAAPTREASGEAGAGAAAEASVERSEAGESAPRGIDRQTALRALRNLEATEARLERNARREA